MEKGRALDYVFLSFRKPSDTVLLYFHRQLMKYGLDEWPGKWTESWLKCRA